MVRLRTHSNPLQIMAPEPFDLERAYGRRAPILLEVGFGRGDFLLGLARAHPAFDVLGLEIRPALTQHLHERRDALGVVNCHAVVADATRHLALLVPPQSVAAAFVLFPDPWVKRRHLKRRVLRLPLLDALARALAPGGTIDVQTDRAELATEADAEIARDGRFFNLMGRGEIMGAPLPDCQSRRCRMHRARGHAVYKLRFARTESPCPAPRPGEPDTWLGFAPIVPGPAGRPPDGAIT